MKTTLFRMLCLINGLLFLAIGLYGTFNPAEAMNLMTGMQHNWEPQTLSLMRMHNGSDIGLGIGFLLVSFRPGAAFSAFALCILSNLFHGLVHVFEGLEGTHISHNPLTIGLLVGASLVLCALYPWKTAVSNYMTSQQNS